MKKTFVFLAFVLLASPLWAGPQDRKSRKQLQKENAELIQRIEQLEAELEAFRSDASDRAAIETELSGENENKVAAALEDYTPGTDTLLGQWYMHRKSLSSAREQYNMYSVRFTSDVPDSVLMRRLAAMNSFITLPYNETVKNYMILYSEKMPRKMGEMLGLSEYYMPIYEETFRRMPEQFGRVASLCFGCAGVFDSPGTIPIMPLHVTCGTRIVFSRTGRWPYRPITAVPGM